MVSENWFKKLNVDRAKSRYSAATLHRAPHKPLLLLAILDLIDEGVITQNLIEPNFELIESFNHYCDVLPFSKRLELSLPFYHMKSEGWWTLIDHNGGELGNTGQLRSIGRLRENVSHAEIDSELWSNLIDKIARDKLRAVLFAYHFQPEMASILAGESNINIDAHHYMKNLMEHKEIDYDSISKPIRDAGFRRSIQRVYDHTCAMTGQRIIIEGRTSIDACHIVPWSVSHNDAIDNGIALSKNCHWAFDNGLLSIDDDYSVVVSPKMKRHSMNSSVLADLHGKELILPENNVHRPSLEYISLHRKTKY